MDLPDGNVSAKNPRISYPAAASEILARLPTLDYQESSMSITHGHILTEWPGLAEGKASLPEQMQARLITSSQPGKSTDTAG